MKIFTPRVIFNVSLFNLVGNYLRCFLLFSSVFTHLQKYCIKSHAFRFSRETLESSLNLLDNIPVFISSFLI